MYKHQSPAVFQTRLDVVPCLCARISLQPCVSNTFDYGCLIVYPPAHTKKKATPELEKILHRARAPNQLSIFLGKEQLFGVDDVALVRTKEDLLRQKLRVFRAIPWLKVCIKNVWALCREAFATGRHGQPASQTEQEDQVLPDEVKRCLDGSGSLAMGSSSIRFVCCRKHSRTKSAGCRMVLHERSPLICWNPCVFCVLSDGKSVKAAPSAEDSIASEEVSGVFELWTRLRAFFTTLAYTSVDQKDWFGFGEREQFVDQVFQWLHLRHSGQRAPIQFYIDAFNNTCATFQSAIRRTLNSVIGNPSEYQHCWTVFVPTKVDNNFKNRERKSWRGEPGTSDYRAGYEKALLTARNLQSERDRVVNELRKLSNETGKGKQYSGEKDHRRDRGPDTEQTKRNKHTRES